MLVMDFKWLTVLSLSDDAIIIEKRTSFQVRNFVKISLCV